MKKFVLLLLVFIVATVARAQVIDGVQTKLAQFYSEQRWEDCAFKADRMVLQGKYENDAEVYLYLSSSYAKIFLMGLEDTMLIYKVPEYTDAYKNALKFSVIAKKKDKKAKVYFPKNNFMLEEIAVTGIYYIDHYMSIKKTAKASSFMRKIMKTYTDLNISFLHAVLCNMKGDTVTGMPIIRDVYKTMDTQRPKDVTNTEFIMIDAFDYYINYLISLEIPLADSARNVANRALRYFPGDALLMYDLQLIDNPMLEISKPENVKKKATLKSFAVNIPGSDDDKDNDDDDDDDDDKK